METSAIASELSMSDQRLTCELSVVLNDQHVPNTRCCKRHTVLAVESILPPQTPSRHLMLNITVQLSCSKSYQNQNSDLVIGNNSLLSTDYLLHSHPSSEHSAMCSVDYCRFSKTQQHKGLLDSTVTHWIISRAALPSSPPDGDVRAQCDGGDFRGTLAAVWAHWPTSAW